MMVVTLRSTQSAALMMFAATVLEPSSCDCNISSVFLTGSFRAFSCDAARIIGRSRLCVFDPKSIPDVHKNSTLVPSGLSPAAPALQRYTCPM